MAHVCRPPLDKEYDACKASAAGMLAFRPHTRSELATKLTDKGYDKACIERSISRLQELASQDSCLLYCLSCLGNIPCVLRSSVSCCPLPSCAHADGLPPYSPVSNMHSRSSARASMPGPDGRSAVLQGLQSDAEFATVFARSKWRQSRWAPSRIRIVSTALLSSQTLPLSSAAASCFRQLCTALPEAQQHGATDVWLQQKPHLRHSSLVAGFAFQVFRFSPSS